MGSTITKFFGSLFTELFNSIYNQQIDQKSARNVIIGFFVIAGVTTAIVGGFNAYKNYDFSGNDLEIKKPEVKVKKETNKPEVKVKKEAKKPEVKVKKEIKKTEKKLPEETKKPSLKVKEKNVAEVILPDLNLKTETVIQLFKDVDYDLSKVRDDKLVKPIYFTQFQEI